MRNLGEIIDKVLAVKTPEDFDYAAFSARLLHVKEKVAFSAPELHFVHWNSAAMILEQYLGEPDAPWKLEILSVWMGSAVSV